MAGETVDRKEPSCSLFSIVVDFPLFFFPNTALPRRKNRACREKYSGKHKKKQAIGFGMTKVDFGTVCYAL